MFKKIGTNTYNVNVPKILDYLNPSMRQKSVYLHGMIMINKALNIIPRTRVKVVTPSGVLSQPGSNLKFPT